MDHLWTRYWSNRYRNCFLEKYFSENEYIYLKCPEGIDFVKDECLEVQKEIYSIVQAKRV